VRVTSEKKGPLKRLAKALGLSKTTGGNHIPYEGCWACSLGHHSMQFDNACTCCRANHTR
jgi:hypothetical protein